MNRLLSRGYPDHGVETFGYSFIGLVAYTNRLSQTNGYFYDAAGRKIAQTNANGEGIEYSNSPAGDLLVLTNGNGKTTTWAYDIYGFMTNKMDANGTAILTNGYDADHRLTKRWSAAKDVTSYAYDYQYDVGGERTNVTRTLSDFVNYTYDQIGQLTGAKAKELGGVMSAGGQNQPGMGG